MLAHGKSIQSAMLDRIHASPKTRVWIPEDFADLGSRDAVDQALHRLVVSKDVRGVARGPFSTKKIGFRPKSY
jgi:hypothetical protein